ncbi:MAG TPA: sensor histidine kinase [Rhizomicrobium sp.]|jgi:two-component system CheB/CheR fusion protein|nr:sensor histidine kinase [Rhizomicrobium sp.]
MESQSGDCLLAEFQHRVKNLMAVVRSIVRRTVETSSGLEDFADHFDGRLTALMRTFRMLGRTGTFEIDFEELVREELLSQAAERRAHVEGPVLCLSQNAATALGLAIHELAVNAVKYGALAGTDGQLSIGWTVDEDGLRLEWREAGVPAVDPMPQRRGFGREWIEQGLPYQLKAQSRLEFLPGGVVCTILVPPNQIGGAA